ncbi:hypothetical protein D9M73_178000 [compost metagenome]
MTEGFDGFEQGACGAEELFALGGDLESALAAAAQAITKAGFQLGHLLADARLAQAQLTLGGTETAALHHADKQTQQLQVQIMELAEHQTLLRHKVRLINLIFHQCIRRRILQPLPLVRCSSWLPCSSCVYPRYSLPWPHRPRPRTRWSICTVGPITSPPKPCNGSSRKPASMCATTPLTLRKCWRPNCSPAAAVMTWWCRPPACWPGGLRPGR